MKEIVTIKTFKFNRQLHRTWKAELIERKDNLLVFLGEFEKEVVHPQLGVIRRKTLSYEYYWLDRWYNVFRFHEPEGELRNFYCNINLPPTFTDGVLSYIDLDIDLLVWKDFRCEILDLEEFEENSKLYSYPDEIIKNAFAALAELQLLLKNKAFPFDFVHSKP